MAQVLGAFLHLDKIGVVHRDLNPANILIDDEDNAKAGEFGLAFSPRGEAPDLKTLKPGKPNSMSDAAWKVILDATNEDPNNSQSRNA
ncbi:hypothetical protein BGX33_011136 [Mortierella sp. NVP41]|nr:hypothetical protein BGX33_011136 [Mortierella sp. NVP41]